MKKISFIFAILMSVCSSVDAVVTQRILLKNGSVLYGFVLAQDRDGSMTISTDSATICISRDVFNISENTSSIVINGFAHNDQNDSALANDKSKFRNCLKNKSFGNVRIIEKGATVRFVENSPNKYEIGWNDVVSIRADRRPQNALSGIKRHYYLKSNREVEGEYAGETESTVSLFQESGVVETIKFSEVLKYTYSPINPDQDIFEQSPLLDIVKTQDGREFKGIIIEQNYSNNGGSENYISVWEQGKSPQMVRISEIASICKEKNDVYNPKYDIILKDGEVLVNRMPVDTVDVKELDDCLILDGLTSKMDSLSVKAVLNKPANSKTDIVVEYKASGNSNVEIFQLVKLTKQKLDKKHHVYGFTYKDLANSIRPSANVETSVNNTTKAQYSVDATGRYALYDSKKKIAIPVIIK